MGRFSILIQLTKCSGQTSKKNKHIGQLVSVTPISLNPSKIIFLMSRHGRPPEFTLSDEVFHTVWLLKQPIKLSRANPHFSCCFTQHFLHSDFI